MATGGQRRDEVADPASDARAGWSSGLRAILGATQLQGNRLRLVQSTPQGIRLHVKRGAGSAAPSHLHFTAEVSLRADLSSRWDSSCLP
jgi:hypothetical protein